MSDPILTDAYWSLGVAAASPLLPINFALIRFTAQQEHLDAHVKIGRAKAAPPVSHVWLTSRLFGAALDV
jgi:hypothetical protein